MLNLLKRLLQMKLFRRSDERRLIRAARDIETYCNQVDCEDCIFKKYNGACRFFGVVPSQWNSEDIE